MQNSTRLPYQPISPIHIISPVETPPNFHDRALRRLQSIRLHRRVALGACTLTLIDRADTSPSAATRRRRMVLAAIAVTAAAVFTTASRLAADEAPGCRQESPTRIVCWLDHSSSADPAR